MAIAPPSYECWTKEDWFGKEAQGTNLWIKSCKKLKTQSLIGQRIIEWRLWTLKQKPRGLVRGHRLRSISSLPRERPGVVRRFRRLIPAPCPPSATRCVRWTPITGRAVQPLIRQHRSQFRLHLGELGLCGGTFGCFPVTLPA